MILPSVFLPLPEDDNPNPISILPFTDLGLVNRGFRISFAILLIEITYYEQIQSVNY